MIAASELHEPNRLRIIFRVEPGSLGPDGRDCVEAFCRYAQPLLTAPDVARLQWELVPRFDKTLPELECRVGSRRLSQTQADQYLQCFGSSFEQIEDLLARDLTQLINAYMAQQV